MRQSLSPKAAQAVLFLRARCPDQWEDLLRELRQRREAVRNELETAGDGYQRLQGRAKELGFFLEIEDIAERVLKGERK